MDYYFFNEKNEDIIHLNLLNLKKEKFFKLKINKKNDLTEIYIKNNYNKQSIDQKLHFFLFRYSKESYSQLTEIGMEKIISGMCSLSHKFSNNLYLNLQDIKNKIIEINISKGTNELFFDKNSFPKNNNTVILSLYENGFNCDNYKEFIRVFPTINESKIQINLYYSTNTKFYFDNILDEIIKNKNFEKAFYLYTLLELYDMGKNIYIVKEPTLNKRIDNDLKSFVESRISKQQLKDICENFESLQKHSINF